MSELKYINATTTKLQIYRNFIDDLTLGSIGIKAKNDTYLPREQSEKEQSYKARLSRATYFDSFNPTINGLVGLIFKNPIIYSDDIPSQLNATIENADMQGNHLDIIIENFFKKALQKGLSFCLVDMPKGEPTSKADEINMGIRPYLTLIEPSNITSWKTEIINGQLVLSQVKIRESVEIDDPNNKFATKLVTRYRILERGSYQVWEENDGADSLIEEGNTKLNFIPLVALNLNEQGFFDAIPPFYDLGDMNIAHYQIFADSRHASHTASVPFYFGSGIASEDVKDLVISPNTFFATHNEGASIDIVDYKGEGVAVNATLLDRIENRMREIGLSVITQDGNVTATEVSISSTQSQSKLNSYVRALEDSVELILLFAAKMYGQNSGGSISIDADILSQPLTAQDVIALNNMVTSGNMSLDTMYKMIASGSFRLEGDFDIDAEKELISSQGLLNDTGE